MNDRGLGKGLDTLLPDEEPTDNELRQIPIEQVEPDPNQPRDQFDEDQLDELTQSIEEQGVVEPVVVRPVEDDQFDSPFVLIAGERRWRASCQAGIKRIPAIVRDLSAEDALAISLIENIQRKDLTPVEEAKAYNRLMNEQNWNQQQLAEQVGRSRSAVANQVRLLNLPDSILDALNDEIIDAGHARALLSLEDDEAMSGAYELIKENDLTVRQTESLIQNWPPADSSSDQSSVSDDKSAQSSNFRQLESSLEDAIGTSVSIESNDRKKGYIKIKFNNPDEFEHIREQLESVEE